MNASLPHYLLDTGILIQYARGKDVANTIDSRFKFRASRFMPLVCVVTIGEIMAIARRRKWPDDKMRRLDEFINGLVVVDISPTEVIDSYAELDSYAIANGKAVGQNDTWIAAAAKATGSVIVTGDGDFDTFHGVLVNRILMDMKSGEVVSE